MKKTKRVTLSVRSILLITLALLLLNGAIGAFLAFRSRTTMRNVIDNHMLGVAKTAATILNGDELAALTEDDIGGPREKALLNKLKSFSDNLDFKYIFVVRKTEDGHFIFITDADPVDPAPFGEYVTESPALLSAGNGIPAVDAKAIEDRWGKYYSTYCPVFCSDGSIGGIVGVDFDTNWYKNQMTRNVIYLLLADAAALIAGGGMALLLTARLRKRLEELNGEVDALSENLGTLMEEISSDARYSVIAPATAPLPDGKSGKDGGIEKLSRDVATLRLNLKRFIDFVHAQAYIDGMTGVGNKAAYLELVKEINDKIAAGTAAFSIAVFDVNGLKSMNDDYGHETGDRMLVGAAECIQQVFGGENVFRIGGDEFIAVLPDFTAKDVEEAFAKLDAETDRANRKKDPADRAVVSFSKGASTFTPGVDGEFRVVFKRADEAMYRDKDAYYREHYDPRRRT
ncbi:MAG: GGDEF domain-containing protein [Clostridia bacterium]|nr:GGDEF domain-containing protein [Clostridia bacterium]